MKQILKRFFSLLLAVTLLLSVIPATAFHAHAEVEKPILVTSKQYTNREYASLAEAVNFAANDAPATITLRADHTDNTLVEIGNLKNPVLTIDLAGNDLTLTGGIEITRSCSLTITDSVGGGTLTVTRENQTVIQLDVSGNVSNQKVTLTIDGVKVSGEQSSLIRSTNSSTGTTVDIQIKNSTLEGDDIIQAAANTTVTIADSTLTASGTALGLENNGAAYAAATMFAKATVTNSNLSSGETCVRMADGTSFTASGTAETPCTFTTSRSNTACIHADKNSTITLENAAVSGGSSAVSLEDCTGSFTNCTFDTRIMQEGGTASFDGCRFPVNAFLIDYGGQAVCKNSTWDPGNYPAPISSYSTGALIFWESETKASIYGEVVLTEDLTIPEGTTYDLISHGYYTPKTSSRIIPGEHTLTVNGTILVDGVEHVHSTEETVVKKDGQKHHTQVLCADCPIGFVEYSNEEDHTMNSATGLCTGCGENIAVFALTQSGTTTYHASFEDALNVIAGEATIQLLADYTVIANLLSLNTPGLTLDLNGKTLTVPMNFTIGENGTVTVKDSTEEGILDVQYSLNLRGQMTLQSGTVKGPLNVEGNFTVNGGEVADEIYTQSSDAMVTVTGGEVNTLSVGDAVGTVRLSGGSFTSLSGEGYGGPVNVSDFLVDGYKYVAANTGADVSGDAQSVTNVKVVCAHPEDYEGSTAANCKDPAYCAQCGETYGEPDPTRHGAMDSATGKCPVCKENIAVFALTQSGTTTYHASFQDAVASITGKATIQLLCDSTESPRNALELPAQEITLDLNGQELTVKMSLRVVEGGKLTVFDGTEAKNGKLNSNIYVHGEMVLESGTIDYNSQSTNTLKVSGKLTVNGGRIQNDSGTSLYAESEAVVRISGGEISYLYLYYYGDPLADLLLSGGTYGAIRTGATSSYDAYPGKNVTEILASGYKYVDAGTGADVSGKVPEIKNVKVVCAHPEDYPDSTPINCKNPGYCAQCGETYGAADPTRHGTIDPATGKCPFCGENLAVASLTQSGTTTYHASFEDAVDAATGAATVQLLENWTVTEYTYKISGKTITLDLNGKELTFEQHFNINEGSKLTVKDSTEAKDGKLIAPQTITISVAGEMILESGAVDCADRIYVSGDLTVNGGTVTGTGEIYTQSDCTVTVTGGSVATLESGFPSAVVRLSGGTFGTIEGDAYEGVYVRAFLVDGYKYVDADTGEDVNAQSASSLENVKVVCSHPANHTGSLPATCAKGAYCGLCGQYYGDTVPHAIDNATGLCKFGCGENMAVMYVMDTFGLTYYCATAQDAFLYANENGGNNGTLTVTLLKDVTEDIFPTIEVPVNLQLRDNTLQISQLSVSSGGELAVMSNGGKLILTSSNGGIHINGGEVSLFSAHITATGGDAVTVNNGRFEMLDGKVQSDVGHGIYVNDSNATVKIQRGTIQAPQNQTETDSDLRKYALRLGVTAENISLSGGTFLGGIHAGNQYVVDLLADHYAYKWLSTGEIKAYNSGSLSNIYSVDMEIVCYHDWNRADDLAATCAKGAYCGYCMKYYGDPDPDNHGTMVLTADDAADTVTETCSLGCDYSKQIKLVVPTDAVYNGGDFPASREGDVTDIVSSLSYWQAGVELNSTPTEPGDYTAKLTVLDPATNTQYSVSADYSIARIAVTPSWITGEMVRKTYDGTTRVVDENIRGYIYTDDFIGFQDVSFGGTMEFASADAGNQDVTVHVTLTGKDAKYYALTTDTVTGKGIISPAPLTVTAQDVTIHYGDPLTATAQYEGFVNGETSAVLEGELTYDTGYDTADPSKRGVGKYTLTPTGLESDNYKITFVSGELTVEARPIRLKIDSKTVIYGDEAPKFTYSYENLAYDDTAADVVNFDFDLDCDYRPGETGAGEVLPIKTSAVDAVPGNYLVTETTLGTLTVTQRPVTPVMDGITQKFYDGTTETNGENHHITVSVAENVLPEDDVTLDLAGTRYASADASDDYIPVIAVGITLGGADADNYYLTATTAQAEIGLINPAPLDIFADEKFITYGDDAPELTVTVKGLAPGETLADLDGELFITTDYDVTDPEKRDVDSYPIYLGGLKSSNYSICFIENFLWVEPAPLDLVIDAKTVIYGDATPGLTYSYKGLKFDDTAEDAGGPILETDYTPGSPAGSVYNIRVASKDVYNANYKVTSFTAANLTVEKRPLTPGLDGHTVKVYDGTTETNGEDHEITVTVMDEVFSGDDVILNFTNIRYASADASDQAVTVIAEGITLSGADADNYYLTATTAKADVGTIHRLDIADMDLPVEDFLYDGTEHTQTVSPEINGLVPTCTVAGQKATGIGCYTLTVTGNGNFCGVATATYYILPNDTDVQELNNTNPTSEDREALEKALAEVTGADRDLADEYLNNILDGQTQSYTELLDLLDKAAAAANTPAIQAVEDITAKNVRAEDKADLEKARVDLEAARNNYEPNYTDAEWVALWEDLERVKEALAVIANAEAVDSVLTQLPDTLDPEDGASMEAVEKVRKDYEQLSEVEKQLVPQEQKEKLDDLLTQLEAIHNAEVIRIYGDDRYATSLKTADELKAVLGVEKFENIVVARGSAFADALSGSYLATRKNAPILLVKAGDEEAVKAYIRQNLVSGGTVYILGGTEAVSAAMETGLEDFRVKRLGGADRYETNLMILEEAGVAGGDILITTGGAYADALSASAVDSPILLVGWKLTDAQLALLRTVSGKRIIVGGENAVSAKVEAGIRNTGETVRVAGADRYETSLLLAKMYFPDPEKAVLVYGENYPDGICGGPLANALKAPVLLVKDSKADAMAQFNASHSITVGYVLGGQKLLANGTVRVAFDMEGNAPIKVK